MCCSLNKPIDVIPDEVAEVFKLHDWPGSFRPGESFRGASVAEPMGPADRLTQGLERSPTGLRKFFGELQGSDIRLTAITEDPRALAHTTVADRSTFA